MNRGRVIVPAWLWLAVCLLAIVGTTALVVVAAAVGWWAGVWAL